MTLQYCLQQNTRFDCIITYSTNQKFCPIFCANQWQNKQQKQNENMYLLLSVANVNDFMFNNYIIVVKKWIMQSNLVFCCKQYCNVIFQYSFANYLEEITISFDKFQGCWNNKRARGRGQQIICMKFRPLV